MSAKGGSSDLAVGGCTGTQPPRIQELRVDFVQNPAHAQIAQHQVEMRPRLGEPGRIRPDWRRKLGPIWAVPRPTSTDIEPNMFQLGPGSTPNTSAECGPNRGEVDLSVAFLPPAIGVWPNMADLGRSRLNVAGHRPNDQSSADVHRFRAHLTPSTLLAPGYAGMLLGRHRLGQAQWDFDVRWLALKTCAISLSLSSLAGSLVPGLSPVGCAPQCVRAVSSSRLVPRTVRTVRICRLAVGALTSLGKRV